MENGGPFVALEGLFWRETNPLHGQPIAVRGILDQDGSITGAVGTFLGSRTVALKADDAGGPGTYQPGFRMTAGYVFVGGWELEVNWIHLFEAQYNASAGVEPAFARNGVLLQETFLTSFVFNFPNDFAGPAQKVGIGNPGATFGIWDASDEQQIKFIQRFDQVELSARIPFVGMGQPDDCTRLYWLLGPRAVWMWEKFWWRTVAFDINTGASGSDDQATYSNIVSQRLYGGHLGCGVDCYKGTTPLGALALSVDVEAALYANLVKEIATYERGDRAISARRVRRDYTLVPDVEARVNLWWYPTEAIQLRLGYDIMAFFNTVSSPDPVSFNVGGLDPPWVKGTTRIFEGISAGIGFVF
jgi:hypothetical protein